MNSYIVEMLISSFYGKVVSGRQQMLNNAKSHERDPGSFLCLLMAAVTNLKHI